MSASELLQLLRKARFLRGAELLARLQESRPTTNRATMMRMIRSLGDQVVMGGAARSSSYAARRAIRGNVQSLPLYQIDQQGRGSQVATLAPIYPNGCLLTMGEAFEWPIQSDWKDGWFAELPYPLDDMRPQGFLGRHFAHMHAATFQVAEDPTRWSEDDVLAVLSVLGSDTSGNLILGEAAYRRHLLRLQEGYQLIAEDMLLQTYAELAIQALAQGEAGSSVGGEFPKFTACRIKDNGPMHVLVKFSGNDQSASAQRWSDLLICEHLALQTINASLPCSAAQSSLAQFDHRTFLEVQRFDRHGEFGRSAICSWAAIEAAMFGIAGSSWIDGAQRLFKEKLISATTLQHISILWYFGKLIANTDMHEGNLSFRPTANKAMLELTPAYDMLPMLYAPVRGVEISRKTFIPVLPMPSDVENWKIAAQAAQQFWEAAANDQRINTDFRICCTENGSLVAKALEKI
jgi:hypothetical protein